MLTDRGAAGAATVSIKSSFQDKKTFNYVFVLFVWLLLTCEGTLLTCTGRLKSSTDTWRVRKLTCKLSAAQIIKSSFIWYFCNVRKADFSLWKLLLIYAEFKIVFIYLHSHTEKQQAYCGCCLFVYMP